MVNKQSVYLVGLKPTENKSNLRRYLFGKLSSAVAGTPLCHWILLIPGDNLTGDKFVGIDVQINRTLGFIPPQIRRDQVHKVWKVEASQSQINKIVELTIRNSYSKLLPLYAMFIMAFILRFKGWNGLKAATWEDHLKDKWWIPPRSYQCGAVLVNFLGHSGVCRKYDDNDTPYVIIATPWIEQWADKEMTVLDDLKEVSESFREDK